MLTYPFVPILVSMLAVIVIIILSPAVALSYSDWMRLALISFVSLLYISVFCNIGFFVSSMTSRSTTSAMFLLFFWVTFILLIPRGSAYIASYLRPVSSMDVINERTRALWDEFNTEVQKFDNAHPVNGTSAWDNGGRKVFLGERRKMMAYLERAKLREPLRIEYADKVASVMQQYSRELEKQASFATTLAKISPVDAYQNVASALAKTDLQSYSYFIQRSRDYRRELIDWSQVGDKYPSDTFGWNWNFKPPVPEQVRRRGRATWEIATVQDQIREDYRNKLMRQVQFAEDMMRISPMMVYTFLCESAAGTGSNRFENFLRQVRNYRNEWREWIFAEDEKDKDSFHILSNEGWTRPFSQKKVDFDNVPNYTEKPIPLVDAVRSGMFDLVLLILFNFVFFIGAYVAFLRYDVR